MMLAFVLLVVLITAYKVWRINSRPSDREIAAALFNFDQAVQKAMKK